MRTILKVKDWLDRKKIKEPTVQLFYMDFVYADKQNKNPSVNLKAEEMNVSDDFFLPIKGRVEGEN